ncbi:MAG: cytochrome c biogenesis heme-transporting ATPase CcmA [Betaproteobacteria bacterium]
MNPTAAALLELRDVTCVRGGRALFSRLQCRLSAGQLLRVRGVNGAGKTSLLRLVCGLLPPAEGQVLWRGERIGDLGGQFGRELVYLGHAAALKDDLTGPENLQTACLLGGLVVTPAQARAALAQAGLPGRWRVPARQLSQGQSRRVALARLLLCRDVPLWVLDEPFNALDSDATDWLCGVVSAHLDAGGLVVLTSHQDVALDAPAERLVPLLLEKAP